MALKTSCDAKNLCLKINCIPIPKVKSVVYLGITMISNLSNICHVNMGLNRVNNALKSLYPSIRFNKSTQIFLLYTVNQTFGHYRIHLLGGCLPQTYREATPQGTIHSRSLYRHILKRRCYEANIQLDPLQFLLNTTHRYCDGLIRGEFLERCQSHSNTLVTESLWIEIDEEYFLGKKQFAQLLIVFTA